MNEKNSIKLTLLYSLSNEISSEEKDGKVYECRKLKRNEGSESYEIRKKRAAIASILSKTYRNFRND